MNMAGTGVHAQTKGAAMTSAIEKRLATARKARDKRQRDLAIPTVADKLLDTLDAISGPSEQLDQVRAWAVAKPKKVDLSGYLCKGIAQWWVTGPVEDRTGRAGPRVSE